MRTRGLASNLLVWMAVASFAGAAFGGEPSVILDLTPGTESRALFPRDMTPLENGLWFMGSTVTGGTALWQTDGTADGTVPRVLVPGIRRLSSLRGRPLLVVCADLCVLLSTEGAVPDHDLITLPEGTSSQILFPPSQPADRAILLTRIGQSSPYALWSTDGTVAGTMEVIETEKAAFQPGYLMEPVGNQLVVYLRTPGRGLEPWVTDGTAAGTRILSDINPGAASSFRSGWYPLSFTHGDELFFRADGEREVELWVTDGTPTGTRRVADVFSPTDQGAMRFAGGLGDLVLFYARTGDNLDLWRTDGTPEGTFPFFPAGTTDPDVTRPGASIGPFLYFPGATASELWRTNGSTMGTSLVHPFGQLIASVGVVGDRLVVAASTDLFAYDPATGTLTALPAKATGEFRAAQGRLFFHDLEHRLGWTDGTPEGTHVIPAETVGRSTGLRDAFIHRGELLFSSRGTTWRTDGTAAGTVAIELPDPPRWLFSDGSRLMAWASPWWKRLWVSDDWAESFTLIHEVPDGRFALFGLGDTADGQYYFLERESGFSIPDSLDLYGTDGTATGTEVVAAELDAPWQGACVSDPTCGPWGQVLSTPEGKLFVATGEVLWRIEPDGSRVFLRDAEDDAWRNLLAIGPGVAWIEPTEAGDDWLLWASDGTPEGTAPAATLPGSPYSLTPVGDLLFFVLRTDEAGGELWVSDLTAAGTGLVSDIWPGPGSSRPRPLLGAGGRLLFTAFEPSTGRELWTSDGTAGGTRLLADLWPGEWSSFPGAAAEVDGVVLFSASEPLHGREQWATDGESVWLAHDIVPGPVSSSPGYPFVLDKRVVFTVFTVEDGREPWAMPRSQLVFGDGFESGDTSAWTSVP